MGTADTSGSLQWALLIPVVLLCLLGSIEWAISARGQSAANEAAWIGAEAVTVIRGSETQARQAALDVARRGGLNGATVNIACSSTICRVTVSGSAPSLIPHVRPPITATVSLPLERS